MLTVKIIESNGGEILIQARGAVCYSPGRSGVKVGDDRAAEVSFETADGTGCMHYSGDIFVMNENGKTVARYTLSSAEYQHGLAPKAA